MSHFCPDHINYKIVSIRKAEGFSHITYDCGCTVESREWSVGDVILYDGEIFRVDDCWDEPETSEECLIISNMNHEEIIESSKATYVGQDTLSWKVKVDNTFKVGEWVTHIRLNLYGEVLRAHPGNIYDVEVWNKAKNQYCTYRWGAGSLDETEKPSYLNSNLKEGQAWEPKIAPKSHQASRYFPDSVPNYKPKVNTSYTPKSYSSPEKVKPKRVGTSVADFIKEEITELSKTESKVIDTESKQVSKDTTSSDDDGAPFVFKKRKSAWE